MIGRLAWSLARSPLPDHRWRRVAVPFAAAAFLLLIVAAASVVVMLQRQEMRERQRTALVAETPAPTDLILVRGVDEWRGEQFAMLWIEPAGADAPILSVLPPGMRQFPAPAQAVVSPALDRLAVREPAIAARYPDRLVLGEEGLRSADELLA